jgi:tetratricopeptide (TPR) repeat protein
MAVAENPNTRRDWKKRESFTSAMVQILIVAVVLAGAVYFFVQRGTRKKEISDRLQEARITAIRDNPGDLKKASDGLAAIFELDDSSKDALALAADIETQRWLVHHEAGSEQKARELLKKAESLDSRTEERFGNAILHKIADGNAAEAEQYAEELRKQGASSAKLWNALGQAYQELGQLAMARQAFSQATDKAWKNPRYYAVYGESLLAQADYRQAVEIFGKGVNANPDHLRNKLGLALARIYREDRVKDAADAINEALSLGDALTPGMKARALAAQAELANFEKRYDDAVKSAAEALAIDPAEEFALFAKARALAFKQDPGALDAFKAAIAANKSAPVLYFTGASMLQAAGNHDGAMALLNDYEKLYSSVQLVDSEGKSKPAIEKDDKYWIVRGDVLRAATKHAEAMAAYDRAIAANSLNLARAHYAKGALFLEQKLYDKALEELDLVTPDDGSGQLAEAYKAKGEVLFAKEDYPAGAQNFAYALTRMRAQQATREELNALVDEVSKMLIAKKQRNTAKAWEMETKPLIQ